MLAQSVDSCAKCGGAAAMKCGRCRQTSYCGRDCQLGDWSQHKLTCTVNETSRLEIMRDGYIKCATDRIAGNIFIMAAYNPSCDIIVEIRETIEEFCKPGSFHFAHLTCDVAPENNINVARETKTSVEVTYKFTNFTQKRILPTDGNFKNLTATQSDPGPEWSVIFTL